jgi:hypothetical protein
VKLVISYTVAKKRFPHQVARLMLALRQSRSRYSLVAPEAIVWAFSWGTDRTPRATEIDPDAHEDAEEHAVTDVLNRTCVALTATVGHTNPWYRGHLLHLIPEEIVILLRDQVRREFFTARGEAATEPDGGPTFGE